MAHSVYCVQATPSTTLNLKQFSSALDKHRFLVGDDEDIQQLFKLIDAKGDGVIDFSEWNSVVFSEESPVQGVVDMILKHGFSVDDVMKTMQLSDPVDLDKLARGFQQLDPDTGPT